MNDNAAGVPAGWVAATEPGQARATPAAPDSSLPERALMTLNSIGDGVLSIDVGGNVTYLNPVAESMTGWSVQEALEHPVAEVFGIIDGVTRETMPNPMLQAIEERKALPLAANCVLVRRDGFEYAIEDSIAPICDEAGEVTGAVMVFRDVSVTRARMEELSHFAHHDVLTDLPNLLLLRDRLKSAIRLAQRHGKLGAVLFVDLDLFKPVNDTLGHRCGDALLRSVARRLVASVRQSDTVCRVGGDEFVVLLSEIQRVENAGTQAKNLLQALSAPYDIAGNTVTITASIGITLYPGDGADVEVEAEAEALIRRADIAMYHAKQLGGNTYATFTADMEMPGEEQVR